MDGLKKAITILIVMILSFTHMSVSNASAPLLQFSTDELDFINSHPTVTIAVDPTFFPYEFIDTDGTYKGIAADYLEQSLYMFHPYQ